LLSKNYKIIVCAQSNAAVDNLLLKCIKHIKGYKYCRIGSSAKIDPLIAEFTLDNLLKETISDQNDLLKEIKMVKTSKNPDKRK